MRDYGKVSTSLWGSQKWSGVSDDGRLLYLYLHTCPHVNSVGCFVLREGYACADLGWQPERFRKAIETLSERSLVGIDTGESVVRIINFLKHDPFTNPKHADGAIRIAKKLPDCHEKLCLFREISGMKHVSPGQIRDELHSLGIGYADPIETQNPLPEPEPEPEKEDADASACSREAFSQDADASPREQILAAIGLGPDGVVSPGCFIGGQGDMAEAERWAQLPGMTLNVICDEIRRIMSRKRDGPPKRFSYFTRAMQELSGQLSAPKLEPIKGNGNDNRTHHPRTPSGSYPSGNRQPGGLVGAAMRLAGGCPDDFDGRG